MPGILAKYDAKSNKMHVNLIQLDFIHSDRFNQTVVKSKFMLYEKFNSPGWEIKQHFESVI